MTTMAAKLKSKGAEVIRNLTPEIKTIKEIAKEQGGHPIKASMASLYAPIRELMIGEAYAAAEMKNILEICVNEADKELKEIKRKERKTFQEMKKRAKDLPGKEGK
jgi:hypothetical protein